MTLLFVLLIMIYGVGQNTAVMPTTDKTGSKSISTTQNKAKEIAEEILGLTFKYFPFRYAVKRGFGVQANAPKETLNRHEKEVINSMLSITKQSQNYTFLDLGMAVVVTDTNMTNALLPIPALKVSGQTKIVQTWIPLEIFQNVSDAQKKVAVVTYRSDKQFKVENVSIMSKVVRIEVGREIVNLVNPLKIRFPVDKYKKQSNKSYAYSCHYYDEKGIPYGTWKTDGCVTTQLSDDVECTCDHMTAFAVLLVEVDNNNIDAKQWEILSYISYVGCSLSTMFTAFSILSFIFNKNVRAEVSSSIHVSLSGALFLLNMSFMLSEWVATLTMKGVCVFIAVTIHYSLLSSFTWMAIEAMHLYLLLARVFNIHFKHYMFKLSLIGWGIPAVLVGSLLSLDMKLHIYGTREVTFSNSNATNAFCWITEPHILYGVNLSYFTIVFILNTVILISVSRQIFKLKQVDNKHKLKPLKDTITVLGLMCLLGSSWGLVFLGSGYISYPILYLFCISNTMQGFSVFVWMCRTTRPEKRKATHTRSLSTVNSTIEKPQ